MSRALKRLLILALAALSLAACTTGRDPTEPEVQVVRASDCEQHPKMTTVPGTPEHRAVCDIGTTHRHICVNITLRPR